MRGWCYSSKGQNGPGGGVDEVRILRAPQISTCRGARFISLPLEGRARWFESTYVDKIGYQRREKTTCSRSCSNTSFRSGKNNGNWKDISEYDSRSKTFILKYRRICFENHKHECVICGENKILDVHHLDQNKFNNSPENLVPLCPTHHQYWHSRYKQEIEEKIYNYINEFKMTTLTQYQQQQQINRTD